MNSSYIKDNWSLCLAIGCLIIVGGLGFAEITAAIVMAQFCMINGVLLFGMIHASQLV